MYGMIYMSYGWGVGEHRSHDSYEWNESSRVWVRNELCPIYIRDKSYVTWVRGGWASESWLIWIKWVLFCLRTEWDLECMNQMSSVWVRNEFCVSEEWVLFEWGMRSVCMNQMSPVAFEWGIRSFVYESNKSCRIWTRNEIYYIWMRNASRQH